MSTPAQQPILITGASRGIGAACALALARAGHDIVVNYQANAEAAQRVVDAVQQTGRRAVAIQADVGRADEVVRLFEQAAEQMGPMSGLVNNAGITGRIGPFSATTDETLERVMAVNVLGVMRCCRQALAHFAQRGQGGVIVNLSSVAARNGSPHEYVHYAASKAAVDAYTMGLAREVAADGIRVCGVAPASTLTDIHATAGEPTRPQRVARIIPMGRLAEPEEIAEAVAWLMSPAASYMTGTTVQCAGGL